MEQIDDRYAAGDNASDPEDSEPTPSRFSLRRALYVVAALVLLVLLAVVPPLVNVSRFQHRVAASIGASIGRPVRIDSIQLTLLPLPGLEIQNFVVAEDPAFGYEPVIRANTVRATLRVSSLWRRRLEFSRISLLEPSVNLVHLPDGRWNLADILLQAERMDAAPTAQTTASEAPRFPYIEATDARVNLKRGMEKLPFSLTDAKFALWLAQPDRWQLRLEAHPSRTDTNVSDTGTLRLDGTLGRAASIPAVPLDLKAEWANAPLGAVSWLVLDEDAGVRGTLDLAVGVHGTMGDNALTARLKLKGARRADFVPSDPLDVDLGCQVQAKLDFHALADVQCAWPPDAVHPGLTLTGAVPDALHPAGARAIVQIVGVPADNLLDALRVASGRTPLDLKLSGTLSGKLQYPVPAIADSLTIDDALLRLGDGDPFVNSSITAKVEADGLHLAPISLELGGEAPATLDATFERTGYTLHLAGQVLRSRLLALGTAIPQIGDGLVAALPAATDSKAIAELPMQIDLVTQRTWNGDQPWTEAPPHRVPHVSTLRHGPRAKREPTRQTNP